VAMCQCPPPYSGLSMGLEGALVYTGQIPKLTFGGHAYGTHGYGIHGYRVKHYPHPSHHLGESAGELEWENQQCQCWLWMEGKHQGQISQTSTDSSMEHPSQPVQVAGAGHCSPAMMQAPTASRVCLFTFNSASTRQVLRT